MDIKKIKSAIEVKNTPTELDIAKVQERINETTMAQEILDFFQSNEGAVLLEFAELHKEYAFPIFNWRQATSYDSVRAYYRYHLEFNFYRGFRIRCISDETFPYRVPLALLKAHNLVVPVGSKPKWMELHKLTEFMSEWGIVYKREKFDTELIPALIKKIEWSADLVSQGFKLPEW